MIPADEDPRQLREDLEIQAVEEAWDDLFEKAKESIPTIMDTPIRELTDMELLVLAHHLITDVEPLDAADIIYEAWNRIWRPAE